MKDFSLACAKSNRFCGRFAICIANFFNRLASMFVDISRCKFERVLVAGAELSFVCGL